MTPRKLKKGAPVTEPQEVIVVTCPGCGSSVTCTRDEANAPPDWIRVVCKRNPNEDVLRFDACSIICAAQTMLGGPKRRRR